MSTTEEYWISKGASPADAKIFAEAEKQDQKQAVKADLVVKAIAAELSREEFLALEPEIKALFMAVCRGGVAAGYEVLSPAYARSLYDQA